MSCYLKNNRHTQFGFKIISAQVGVFLLLINDPIRMNYKTKNYEKSDINNSISPDSIYPL